MRVPASSNLYIVAKCSGLIADERSWRQVRSHSSSLNAVNKCSVHLRCACQRCGITESRTLSSTLPGLRFACVCVGMGVCDTCAPVQIEHSRRYDNHNRVHARLKSSTISRALRERWSQRICIQLVAVVDICLSPQRTERTPAKRTFKLVHMCA